MYQLNNVSNCMSCLKLELFELKSALFVSSLSHERIQDLKSRIIDETQDRIPTCQTLTPSPTFIKLTYVPLETFLTLS